MEASLNIGKGFIRLTATLGAISDLSSPRIPVGRPAKI